jgi:hypothetical protein
MRSISNPQKRHAYRNGITWIEELWGKKRTQHVVPGWRREAELQSCRIGVSTIRAYK